MSTKTRLSPFTGNADVKDLMTEHHGGKVLKHPVYVPIYVGNYFQTAEGQAYRAHADAFARSFGTSSGQKTMRQYGVDDGSYGGSAVVDMPNPKRLTIAQVEQLIAQQIREGAVTPNAEGVYTAVLPPKTVLDAGGGVTSLFNAIGGLHGSIDLEDGRRAYYAILAYSEGINGIDFATPENGLVPKDSLTINLTHEWREAATNPDVNRGVPAWYNRDDDLADPDAPDAWAGNELDDMTLQHLPMDQAWGRDENGYATQKTWSNHDQKFEIAPDLPGGGPVIDPTTGRSGTP